MIITWAVTAGIKMSRQKSSINVDPVISLALMEFWETLVFRRKTDVLHTW